MAQKSSSISTQVLAYRLWVQLNIRVFDFYKATNSNTVAKCFEKDQTDFTVVTNNKLQDLIKEAQAVIELGLGIATSVSQVWYAGYCLFGHRSHAPATIFCEAVLDKLLWNHSDWKSCRGQFTFYIAAVLHPTCS